VSVNTMTMIDRMNDRILSLEQIFNTLNRSIHAYYPSSSVVSSHCCIALLLFATLQ